MCASDGSNCGVVDDFLTFDVGWIHFVLAAYGNIGLVGVIVILHACNNQIITRVWIYSIRNSTTIPIMQTTNKFDGLHTQMRWFTHHITDYINTCAANNGSLASNSHLLGAFEFNYLLFNYRAITKHTKRCTLYIHLLRCLLYWWRTVWKRSNIYIYYYF